MRLIDVDTLIDALNSQDLADWLSEQEEYTPASIVEHALETLPTVDAVPVSFIESEIKRMDNQIKRATKDDDDEWAERAIIRKLALEFTLAKWRAEREE